MKNGVLWTKLYVLKVITVFSVCQKICLNPLKI